MFRVNGLFGIDALYVAEDSNSSLMLLSLHVQTLRELSGYQVLNHQTTMTTICVSQMRCAEFECTVVSSVNTIM